jgi:cell division protein FtsB
VPPSRFVQRLFTVIPALVAMAVLAVTLLGQDGLLRRHLLRRQLVRLQAEAGELQRDNELLRREVLRLQQSRTAIEREAAESLLVAGEGTVIYRFHGEAEGETE